MKKVVGSITAPVLTTVLVGACGSGSYDADDKTSNDISDGESPLVGDRFEEPSEGIEVIDEIGEYPAGETKELKLTLDSATTSWCATLRVITKRECTRRSLLLISYS